MHDGASGVSRVISKKTTPDPPTIPTSSSPPMCCMRNGSARSLALQSWVWFLGRQGGTRTVHTYISGSDSWADLQCHGYLLCPRAFLIQLGRHPCSALYTIYLLVTRPDLMYVCMYWTIPLLGMTKRRAFCWTSGPTSRAWSCNARLGRI